MIHLFDDCFNNNIVSNPDDIKSILDRIYKHIENSFEILKRSHQIGLQPLRQLTTQNINFIWTIK